MFCFSSDGLLDEKVELKRMSCASVLSAADSGSNLTALPVRLRRSRVRFSSDSTACSSFFLFCNKWEYKQM